MKWREGITFEKDPDSNEPRGLDWTGYLAQIAANETISTSTFVASAGLELDGEGDPDPEDDDPLTLNSASIVTGSRKTQVRYSAGTVGQRYKVTNHIVTNTGVIDERSFYVEVRER